VIELSIPPIRGRHLIGRAIVRLRAAARFLVDPSLILVSTEDEDSVIFGGESAACVEAGRVWNAFRTSMALGWKLPEYIVNLPGASGRKYRHFINCLVNTTRNAAYLEIGSWTGSTACAAMASNDLRAVCIDNWSQFGGPKAEF
jgi:hypothetical protein